MRLTEEERMKSWFCFEREEKTEEVIPAKQVTDAALTCKKKWLINKIYISKAIILLPPLCPKA